MEKTYINLANVKEISEHVKDCGIANPTIEASARNLALASMIGKQFHVDVEIHVELIAKKSCVVGKDNVFPKLIMEIPCGTVIGPWKTDHAHALEFKHWAKTSKGMYIGESYPAALKERELDMTVIKAVKTDAPTPTPTPTATANDNDKAIARRVMEKLNDMDKFCEIAKVAELVGWETVERLVK